MKDIIYLSMLDIDGSFRKSVSWEEKGGVTGSKANRERQKNEQRGL